MVDTAVAEPVRRLEVTLPAGDAEIVSRLQERSDEVDLRRAGATILAESTVPDPARAAQP